MAICIKFSLLEINGTAARYRFGGCNQELDGIFEIDLYKLMSCETPGSTPMNEVVRLLNEKQSEFLACRAFSKIYYHFKEHNEYLKDGGYYA